MRLSANSEVETTAGQTGIDDVPLRMPLIGEDVGLYDRLRNMLAQIEGRRFHLEKEGPLKESEAR